MGLLRFLLASSVVLSHSTPIFGFRLIGGEMAVQTFYIISGFYMGLILNEKYHSYFLFVTNRLLRLYPVYWATLFLVLITSILSWYFGISTYELSVWINNFHKINFISLFYLFFTNIFLFGQDLVAFMGLNTSNGSLFFTENFQKFNPRVCDFVFLIYPKHLIGTL